jgi:NhaP-type Na+/H+ or K+/H+ antiporter
MSWDELLPSVLINTHLAFFAIGLFLTLFGLVSLFLKDKLFMSEAFLATCFGVLLSSIGVFEPTKQFASIDYVTLEFTRVVLNIQCLAAGVACPGNYIQKEWKSLAMLLGPTMIFMWLISALGIYLILGLSITDALVIAACITPTDPVLANSIVKGRFAEAHVPGNVRLLISAESAMNDGLGTPMLLLPIYLMRYSNPGLAIGTWFYKVILYHIGLSIIAGIVIGIGAQKALKFSEKYSLIDKENLLSFSVALALTITGALSSLGLDDILASFIAGTILTWDSWFNRLVEESHIQEVLDNLINLLFFIFIGTRVDFSAFASMELYKLFLYAIWVLLLRRLPIVMILRRWIPALKDDQEAFFCGYITCLIFRWFGPIGAGSLFYSLIAIVYLNYPASPLWMVVLFTVLSSIAVHGGTVSLFHFGLTQHQTWRLAREARLLRLRTETNDQISVVDHIHLENVVNDSELSVAKEI